MASSNSSSRRTGRGSRAARTSPPPGHLPPILPTPGPPSSRHLLRDLWRLIRNHQPSTPLDVLPSKEKN
ncbi:hypothetical protein ACXYTP_23595 [Tsukamurella ocularis]